VWQVGWSHPKFGSLLASCSYDRKVIIWKETNGTWGKLYEYNNHDSSVNSVCWAPYEFGLMLACGSSDGAISVIWSSGKRALVQLVAIGMLSKYLPLQLCS
jgi:protein transport protein SEC13